MKYAIILVLALILAACGGGQYSAPPAGNGHKPGPGQQPPANNTVKPGQNYANEYKVSAQAALAAWSDYGADKTAANFAACGRHLYDAQRYKIMSSRNRNSTDSFYKVTEVSRLFTDWKKTFQGGDWESDPDYKAAKKAYDEVQQTTTD